MHETNGQLQWATGNHPVVPGAGRPPDAIFGSLKVPDSPHALQCVVICTVGELFGGVERHVLGAIRGLSDKGIRSVLILFHDGELAAQARLQGVDPIILPSSNRRLIPTSRQLARILKAQEVLLVHVHGYKAMVFCALARRQYPFAIVKTEHGLPEAMAGRPMGVLRDRLYHFLDRIATWRARASVCYVTEELRMHYRNAHPGFQGIVIPNGITAPDRHKLQRPAELREDRFNLIIVGRLDSVKGHHIAIDAIAALNLSPEIHLHIVGTGPRDTALRDQVKSRGIENRVHFVGFRRNIYDYIAFSEVLLIPSMHEGLPYTLLEAMGLGIPIVASNIGGLAEVLQDGGTALLVPPGDVESLAHAIIRLHADPGLCRQLGENAKRLQQTKYSLTVMVERYLEVYRESLSTLAGPMSGKS